MGDPSRGEIALTFDDGPHPRDTPQLLEVLAKHQVLATFFWLGINIEQGLPLVQAAAQAGHQIAIHGYDHRPFPAVPAARLEQQLDYVRLRLAEIIGRTPSDVRPPFGVFVPSTLRSLVRWGYRPVMWSVVPLHWLQPAQQTVQQVVRQTRAGTLIVLHEGRQIGPPVAQLTDAIISQLTAAQLRFVTVDQLGKATT